MKFRIQARLCLAIYEFEARIMLSQWRSKGEGQVGARALGRRPWGRISILFAVI